MTNKFKIYLFTFTTSAVCLQFLGRRGWMNERVQHCQEFENKKCDFPLSWSISPHLLYLAPDWLHWYYAQANVTGQDVFVLPPSGHLYAYPGK